MEDLNKLNTHYFESISMKGLHDSIETWQIENKKRLLSLNIQKDKDVFCCIALTNPTEVTIVGGISRVIITDLVGNSAFVDHLGRLKITDS